MIAKAKTVQHTGQSIAYGMRSGLEVDRNMIGGDTAQEISAEFDIFQRHNARCENNSISIVVSPTIEDGNKLTPDQWKRITREQLDGMGLRDHQYISFLHTEKEHKHLHIYVNRIDQEGKAYNDKFIGKKASQVAYDVAQKLDLTTAKDVKIQNELRQSDKVQFLKNKNQAILGNVSSLGHYVSEMEKRGVKTNLKFDSNQNLRGVAFEVDGELIKGSDVHRNLSGSKIETTIQESFAQKQSQFREQNKDQDKGMHMGMGLSL